MKNINERIYTFSNYMRNKYRQKVFKLGLSMNEVCHHRKNKGGCIFCLPDSFTDRRKRQSIDRQITYLLPKMRKLSNIFIAYFQDETPFDLDLSDFKNYIEAVLKYDEIKEITISTRPDVLKKTHLDYLDKLDREINIEIGIQTVNDKSLEWLNRGHSFSDIKNSLHILKKYDFRVGVHLIFGIPNESFDDYLDTINFVNSENIQEIKIHNLVAYKNTKLAEILNKSQDIHFLNLQEYLNILLKIIPYIKSDIVISRLFTSNLNREGNAVNSFEGHKINWLNRLNFMMNEQNTIQGSKYLGVINEKQI